MKYKDATALRRALQHHLQLIAKKFSTALHLTFDRHKKHPLPQELPAPSATKFATLAAECYLELPLEDAYTIVRGYYAQISVS